MSIPSNALLNLLFQSQFPQTVQQPAAQAAQDNGDLGQLAQLLQLLLSTSSGSLTQADASESTAATTQEANATAFNPNVPYELKETQVPFLPQNAPKVLVYKGISYQLSSKQNEQLIYKAVDANKKTRQLKITYTGETAQVVVGYQKVQVPDGTQKVQVGTQKVQVPYQYTDIVYDKVIVKIPVQVPGPGGSLQISREVDGVDDTGTLGTIFTQPTIGLDQANTVFTQPGAQQFLVSNLLGEDNQAQSGQAVLFGDKVLGADELFVAGDPQIGGKRNNFQPVGLNPDTGFITMFEDGIPGQKVTVNAHVDTINAQGNKAFTEYGFVVDNQGQKTTAVLSGGQLLITGADGQSKKLLPGDQFVVGDPQDPIARFYYDNKAGGHNGTLEQRLVFESYERPTQASIAALVAQGVNSADAAKLRTTTQMTFGFRVPDGLGNTYRASGGVGDGSALTSSNGVKTYYDAHFAEGDKKTLPTSTTTTQYKDVEQTVPRQVIKTGYNTVDVPIFNDIPKYKYVDQPIYQTLYKILKEKTVICPPAPPAYTPPAHTPPPVYHQPPVFTPPPAHTPAPAYTPPAYNQPTYEKPFYTPLDPAYMEDPVYSYRKSPAQEAFDKETAARAAKLQAEMDAKWDAENKAAGISPLVFDLNGNGKLTTSGTQKFDINNDGKIDTISKIDIGDGLLAFDTNGNGVIGQNGGELFGNFTDLNGDGKADGYTNGFEALKAYAAKYLGANAANKKQLNATDIRLLEAKGLRILVNGVPKKLSELGISQINLGYAEDLSKKDTFGNGLYQQSSFTLNDQQRNVTDVWFKLQSQGGAKAVAP